MNDKQKFIDTVAHLINEDPNIINQVEDDNSDKRNVTTIEILDNYLLETISSNAAVVDSDNLRVSQSTEFPPDDLQGKRFGNKGDRSVFNQYDGEVLVKIPFPNNVVDVAGNIQILINGEVIEYSIKDIVLELNSYSILMNFIRDEADIEDHGELDLGAAGFSNGNLILKYVVS